MEDFLEENLEEIERGLLSEVNIEDDDDIIGTYCFEMEYGKDYKPSYLKDEGGHEIDLSTPEKLYDYLVGEM